MTIRLVTQLRGLLRRSRAATELDEELQFHLEHEIEANVARGMSAGEARRVALRDLGGLMQTREAVRNVRSLWIESVWRDGRHAVRALIAAPSFSAAFRAMGHRELLRRFGADAAAWTSVHGRQRSAGP